MKKITVKIMLVLGLFQWNNLYASTDSSEIGSLIVVSAVVIPSVVIAASVEDGSEIAGNVVTAGSVAGSAVVESTAIAGSAVIGSAAAAGSAVVGSAAGSVAGSAKVTSAVATMGVELADQVLESAGNSQTLLSKDGVVVMVKFSTPSPNLVITDFLTKQELKKSGVDVGTVSAYANNLGVLLYTKDKIIVFYPKAGFSKIFNEKQI